MSDSEVTSLLGTRAGKAPEFRQLYRTKSRAWAVTYHKGIVPREVAKRLVASKAVVPAWPDQPALPVFRLNNTQEGK